ncbi:MAG: lytic murein transglycosylase B [Pseudomonadota bacterium]
MRKTFCIPLLLLVSWPGYAQEYDQPYVDRADVADYRASLVREHGFDNKTLKALFDGAYFRTDIIERISRPAERVWTWGRYKNLLVSDERIDKGVTFWRENQATLDRATQTYGVPQEYIVAILGIETYYGKVKGDYPVLDALMTLGFDYPPRSKFFRKELTEFLMLAREEGKDPRSLMGSYAGAMGYGQFISSSYRHYAVDFSGDGVRDIWDDRVDAIGSIANYFVRHKWKGEFPVAVRLDVSAEQATRLDTLVSKNPKLAHTVGGVRDLGVEVSRELTDELKTAVFKMEFDEAGVDPEYWLGLHDFYVITRYNHSHLYAMAVEHIAQGIKTKMDAP